MQNLLNKMSKRITFTHLELHSVSFQLVIGCAEEIVRKVYGAKTMIVSLSDE